MKINESTFQLLLACLFFVAGPKQAFAWDTEPDANGKYDKSFDRPTHFPDWTQPSDWPNAEYYLVCARFGENGPHIENYEVAVYDQNGKLRHCNRSRAKDNHLCTLTIKGEEGDQFHCQIIYGDDFEHPTIVDVPETFGFISNDVVGSKTAPFWLTAPLPESITYRLSAGWNWLSTNQEAMSSMTFLTDITDLTDRLVSQTQELIKDPVYGLVGNLNSVVPGTAYKLHLNAAYTFTRNGQQADPSMAINLHKGWNWLGYLLTMEKPIADALGNMEPSNGDRLVSQEGFVEYLNGTWTGSIDTMEPGKGYLYYSAKDALLVYPSTSSGSNARSSVRTEEYADDGSVTHWQTNVHCYPDMTTIIAQVAGWQEECPFIVAAFCGDECRGVGKVVVTPSEGNGQQAYIFLSVNGTSGLNEVITFLAYDPTTGDEYPLCEAMTFQGQCLGSLTSPLELHLGLSTQITALPADGQQQHGQDISYDLQGRKVENGHMRKGLYINQNKKVVVK